MTPDEYAAACISEVWENCREWKQEAARKVIAAAIHEALKDRDMQWWEKLALVDNVGPTPEDVQKYLFSLDELVRQEEREKIVEIVRKLSVGTDPFCCKQLAEDIEAAIKARGK